MKVNRTVRRIVQLFSGSVLLRFVIPAILIAACYWFILQLNLFYVEKIIIEPYATDTFMYIDEDKILDNLVDYQGRRILRVKTSDVSETVLLSDPYIEIVLVSKRLPSTLVVRIIEKDSAAVVREGNINQIEQVCAGPILDSDVAVDENGRKIAQCEDNMRACVRLPLFVVSTAASPTDVMLTKEKMESLFSLVNELNEKKVKIQGFGCAGQETIIVSFTDSTRGIFSLDKIHDGITEYLMTRESLLLEGKTFKEIDVRFERPIVRVDKYSEWVLE